MNLTGAEISPNIAEIYVGDGHVKLILEVYIDDLDTFKALIPDDWLNDGAAQRPPLEERLKQFATRTFQVVTDSGEHLPAELVRAEPRLRTDRQSSYAGMINPYTRQRVPESPADKRVLYAEIIYPFSEQPAALTFIPPQDDQQRAAVTIGFIAYHKSVPVIDFRYLGAPATLNLDWEDPWYSQFDNRNLTRHHKYPLMLYLYVEPRQVRLESLTRVSDLVAMTGFDSTEADRETDAHKRLRNHAKEFFSSESPLNIDDKLIDPDAVTVSYFTVSLSGIMPVENPSTIDDPSLLVGVSRQYYVDALPRGIRSEWPYFNERADRIPFAATDPAGLLPSFIDQDDPVFSWKNYLKKYEEPVMRPSSVETGWRIKIPYLGESTLFDQVPDEQQAERIISLILENLRIAFIEKRPDRLSKALAEVVAPDQVSILTRELSKLYAPGMKRGGTGAVKTFGDLQTKEIRALEGSDGFSAIVSGSTIIHAMHWGHTDQLELQFQLLIDLVEVDGQWRMNDLTVINIKESS